MKTIKQIADDLGVSKQRVYRYIKANNIGEAHRDRVASYYDESAETLVKLHFKSDFASTETHQNVSSDTVVDTLVAMLQKELDAKNQQISELTSALTMAQQTIAAEQALHAGTMKHLVDEGVKPQPGFFSRIFGQSKNMS